MLEHRAAVLPVEKICSRDDVAEPSGRLLPDEHDAVGIGVRKRSQEHTIDEAEDRAVGPDAEGEREDGDRCEAWIPDERSHAVANVLQQLMHTTPPVENRLLDGGASRNVG